MFRLSTPTLSLLLLTLAASCHSATDGGFEGNVTRIWDGDTVTVTTAGRDVRVRLSGIDAPEHDQPFGAEATARLVQLLEGKAVRVDGNKTDKYGRLVAKVWVQPADCRSCGKTLDASLGVLTVGLAWWYRYFKDDQSAEDQGRYEFAEFEAKAKRIGLWQDPNPTAPWDWPRGERAPEAQSAGCNLRQD